MQAGEAAQAVLAWEDAVDHWRTALRLMEEHDTEPERRAEVLERLGDLMYYTDSDRKVGIAYLEQALALHQALGHDQTVAEIHTRIGRFMSSTPYIRNVPRILEHYRAAETILRQAPEGTALCSLYVAMASTATSAAHTGEGLATSQRAMEMAQRLNDQVLWADAARTHGAHLLNSGRLTAGFAMLDRAWSVADRLDHAIVGFWATMHHALFARRLLLDPLVAVSWWEREIAKPRLAQAQHLRLQMTGGLIESLAMAGKVDVALTLPQTVYPDPKVALDLAIGNWADAEQGQSNALDQARRAGDRNNTDWYASGLARVLRVRGDPARAEPLLHEALAVGIEGPRVGTELLTRADLALLCAEVGRTNEAATHVARCREIQAAGEDWRGVAGRISLADAVVAANRGEVGIAERRFGEAVATFRGYSLPWDEAEALTYWGRVLCGAGQKRDAAVKFADARGLYQRIGAGDAWHERLANLSDQTIPIHHVPPSYPDGLTPREVEVLGLLAEGLSNREIAETLVVSVRTVGRHVDNIYGKIGVHDRGRARQYAREHGLVATQRGRHEAGG